MYSAPVKDLRFVLQRVLDVSALTRLPRYADYSPEVQHEILEAASRFAEDVLEPLNAPGDREGARMSANGVTLPSAFHAAYQQFIAGGWPQLAADADIGGQGAPLVIATAVEEIWFGANMALMLCPMLSRAAGEALHVAGSAPLQAEYLPPLLSGAWAGTMNLTEPHAGSDLSTIRTRAAPEGDHYRLFGQKIFITYGEHDLTENIVHLVLARIDGAPAGVKGISLFLVPRFLTGPDGQRRPNDVRCASIEHKLGIHLSPTCVMMFGQSEGAVGYLIGEPHHGLEYMFVMMNSARLAVGVQGIGLAERGWQQALQWARTRVQGRPAGAAAGHELPIAFHPDVRRMLLTIKSGVEAMRALALYAALQLDLGRALPDAPARQAAQLRAELLIPVVKGWSTEWAVDLVSLSLQVHGGMGYVEETGVAQTFRDVRIASIYEGTTGIQANDLLGRKLARDRGAAMYQLLQEAEGELAGYRGAAAPVAAIARAAAEGLSALRSATDSILAAWSARTAEAQAVSVPYLMLCGFALGGWLTARAAAQASLQLSAEDAQAAFLRAKLQSARFYADATLPQAGALSQLVRAGGASIVQAEPELL
jgi:alkylation response protein AidB-like acyl-CoA dehydrogenase